MTDKLRDEFADLRADALREGLISSMVDVEVLWACFVLCRQVDKRTVSGGATGEDKLREEFEALFDSPSPRFERTGAYRNDHRQSMWQGWKLRQPDKQLRAALEYTNVLLAKLPPSEEITYRLNANKAVLNETKN